MKISNGFIAGLLIWLGIILLRKNNIFVPIVNNYLCDFITIPMYCYVIWFVMNVVLGFKWEPDLKFIITSVLYISLLFEVICPQFSDRFVGDIYDASAYLLGGLGYFIWKKRKQKQQS